jgi:hypothetical protein
MDWTAWAGVLVGAGGIVIWNTLRDTVFCSLKLWICWYTTNMIDWVYQPVEGLLDQMPDVPDGVMDIGELPFCLNHWVPLFEMIGFEMILLYISTSWIIIRMIKSFIPTMAN